MAEGGNILEGDLPVDINFWSKDDVRDWVHNLNGVEETNAERLFKEEVNGASLVTFDLKDLKDLGINGGPAKLILKARKDWVESKQEVQPYSSNQSKSLCNPYPFGRYHDSRRYIEKNVLQTIESGSSNLIEPCHEFKAFTNTTDETKMDKFIYETIRFAAGCMNSRTNGTIHFGIGDTPQGYEHGQVLGVVVENKEEFDNKLKESIGAHFQHQHVEEAKKCIKPPRFVGVLNKNMTLSNKYVIEVDIVPDSLICKGNDYHTYSHNMNIKKARKKLKKTNSQPTKEFFVRDGGSTVDLLLPNSADKNQKRYKSFRDRISEQSELRKRVEDEHVSRTKQSTQGAHLVRMVTGGSSSLDKSHFEHYVIVLNKSHPGQLLELRFLEDLNPIAVLDFDPESARNGVHNYLNQFMFVNDHQPAQYTITEKVGDMAKKLNLTRNTSWIFCNGRTEDLPPSEKDLLPSEKGCWFMEKGASVRNVISFLCRKDVLPKKRFMVIFLFLSTVNEEMDPLVETFGMFSQELGGTEQILCISGNESGFTSWKDLIEARYQINITPRCIFELSLVEVNGTILSLWSEKQRSLRFLPCGGETKVILEKKMEQSMSTLEVLCMNECEGGNKDILSKEENFYRGGKVTWWNFYYSEQPGSSQFIRRDKLDHILETVIPDLLSLNQICVVFNLSHTPGCGATTLAMHTLWCLKNSYRCAVQRENIADQSEIAKQVVQLLTLKHDEDTPKVPVILMIDDVEDEDKVSDLQELIETECMEKGIQSKFAQVLLLACKRSLESTPNTVFLRNDLSEKEQRHFAAKLGKIEKIHKNAETFYGFMIMKTNFKPEYIQGIVRNTLKSFDKKNKSHQLLAVLALLNVYCCKASLSVSLCEEFLEIQPKPVCGKNTLKNFIEDEFGKFSPLIGCCIVEGNVQFSAINILHSSIAKECLKELLTTHNMKKANIADILLTTDKLYVPTQGLDYFRRQLYNILLARLSKQFSPLVEDIACESPGCEETVIENASKRFENNAFVCQLLARYKSIRKKNFDEAKQWAKEARTLGEDNSCIADTLPQVIKQKLKHAIGNPKKEPLVPKRLAHYLKLAKEATEGFKETQRLAIKESVWRLKNKQNSSFHNTAGHLGEMEIGVLVIGILEQIPMFSSDNVRNDLMCFVLAGKTKIGDLEKMDPQRNKPFYEILKQYDDYLYGLKSRMKMNFDFMDKFDTHLSTQFGLKAGNKQELDERVLICFKHFSRIFCETNTPELNQVETYKTRQFLEKEKADSYTGILKCLYKSKPELEQIARGYDNICKRKTTSKDLINSIYVSVVLSCTKPESRDILPYEKLIDRLQQVLKNQISLQDSLATYFMAVVLLWPTECVSLEKYIPLLRDQYYEEMKEVYCGKWPVIHFFLGSKPGYNQLVHLRQIQDCLKCDPEQFASLWRNGQTWKDETVKKLLLRVTGEKRRDLLLVHRRTVKLAVSPMSRSQISGYADGCKMSFFIGFTMRGPTALDVVLERN